MPPLTCATYSCLLVHCDEDDFHVAQFSKVSLGGGYCLVMYRKRIAQLFIESMKALVISWPKTRVFQSSRKSAEDTQFTMTEGLNVASKHVT
jgi:hypothetical protein